MDLPERNHNGAEDTFRMNAMGSFVPLQILDSSTGSQRLELFTPQQRSSKTASGRESQLNTAPIVRLKRKLDTTVDTLVIEHAPKKRTLNDVMASLSTTDKPKVDLPSTRRTYRKVSSLSASQAQAVRGFASIIHRIPLKSETTATQPKPTEAAHRRKQGLALQGREKKVAQQRITSGLPKPAKDAEEEQQKIVMNYMPMVREFLRIERSKEEERARKAAQAALSALEDYELEIYQEAEADAPQPAGASYATIKVVPFDEDLVLESEYSDDEDDDYDSNAEDNSANDYPDEPDEDSSSGAKANDEEASYDELSSDEDGDIG